MPERVEVVIISQTGPEWILEGSPEECERIRSLLEKVYEIPPNDIRRHMEVVTIQTDPEWLHSTDAAAMDAKCLPFEEWLDIWPDECNCVLEGQSCPACRDEARKPYGESIPFEF